ncbi:hypothetical protein B1A_12713 [mine drainage metagenome]|uniref:Uncharacterized protein n=1 Tax=mine drainage metagenome TaxID=410659 RepID=T1BGY9_9ZZZZ
MHFNVGGAQAVEDSLKLVRNFKGGKSLMMAYEGGYHGRTLGARRSLPVTVTGGVTDTSATAPCSCHSRITFAGPRA